MAIPTAVSDRVPPAGRTRSLWPVADRVLVALVVLVAVAVRLVPVLRGSGLRGSIDYDGSVYYGAAAGLAHGLTPYRDFLLLHPPGIMLALVPFAAVGRIWGDADGLALARLAFTLLGAVNAVLVSRILRSRGRWPAVVGGLFYALFFPAVFMERSISLEGAATSCLLVALLLLLRPRPGTSPLTRTLLLAGVLLGFGMSLKIWGVVVVAAVLVWTARRCGVRGAALVAAGSALGATLVCGPFFLAAPGPMWRMVVADQLGRPDTPATRAERVREILGLAGPGAVPRPVPSVLVVAALLVAVLCLVLALRTATGGIAVLLTVACGALLLITPSWFAHYAGLTAAPAALVVGSATSWVVERVRRRWAIVLLASLAAAGLVASVGIGVTRTFGAPLAVGPLVAAAAGRPGCVTADDATELIESNLLGRNLDRGCPLVVDLGGYAYDLPNPAKQPRKRNPDWQVFARRYLSSGDLTVISRFRRNYGFDSATAAEVNRWPLVARASGYRVRKPG